MDNLTKIVMDRAGMTGEMEKVAAFVLAIRSDPRPLSLAVGVLMLSKDSSNKSGPNMFRKKKWSVICFCAYDGYWLRWSPVILLL